MIEFTKGDMFEMPVDIRVNSVNCKGVMGAGVALAFRERYPEMFKDYQQACREGTIRPGALHVWKNLTDNWIINFPTKRDWREPSRYEDILAGLQALRSYLKEQGPVSVALPALGCGHGGLDWGRVSSMIEDNLGDLDASIFVFQPADSHETGRVARDQPTADQIMALKNLGFRIEDLSQRESAWELPSTGLVKGNPGLLDSGWIALLPSRSPGEREREALQAVARQMVAAPEEPWSRSVLARSMTLLRSGASSVLVSDPEPKWLASKAAHAWAKRAVFYLRYGSLPVNVRRMLDEIGAQPIGRSANTGEPNLGPLLEVLRIPKRSDPKADTVGGEHFHFLLSVASAQRLCDVAAAIEQAHLADGLVRITVPHREDTEDLRAELRRIVADERGHTDPTSGPASRFSQRLIRFAKLLFRGDSQP